VSALFLPFTPTAKEAELRAIEVKRDLGLGPYARVDPYSVLPQVPAQLIPPEAVSHLPDTVRHNLLERFTQEWSAIGFGPSLVTGAEMIWVNPTHHPHRQRVSLMEEIVHIVCGHPRVSLVFDGEGTWQRPFDDDVEDEAFCVGAACIIPYRWLLNRIKKDAVSSSELGEEYDVSSDYAEYRIKRAGLYSMWRSRVKQASP
jgi:hypothetical protein